MSYTITFSTNKPSVTLHNVECFILLNDRTYIKYEDGTKEHYFLDVLTIRPDKSL